MGRHYSLAQHSRPLGPLGPLLPFQAGGTGCLSSEFGEEPCTQSCSLSTGSTHDCQLLHALVLLRQARAPTGEGWLSHLGFDIRESSCLRHKPRFPALASSMIKVILWASPAHSFALILN